MREANFDGLVGPSHNFAGLAKGNFASTANQGLVSRPRLAALQGLAKAKLLLELGVPQAVLPPPARPALDFLRQLGFSGSPARLLEQSARHAPAMLAHAYSASAMWAANAATVTPSRDSVDGRLHITVANLCTHLHRSLESDFNFALLRRVFSDPSHFLVHPPLPAHVSLADEGAANHLHLMASGEGLGHSESSFHVFVYGRAEAGNGGEPRRFPARQSLEASRSVARLHQLSPQRTFFVQQNPRAIDYGIFHNDVIALAHRDTLLVHEQAFVDTSSVLATLNRTMEGNWHPWVVLEKELDLEQCVRSYMFNSQLVSQPDGRLVLIAPEECVENVLAQKALQRLTAAGVWQELRYIDLRQSMRNGGGPACLRLRVPLSEVEHAAVHQGCWLDAALHARLCKWVEHHYRETLTPDELRDPQLVEESHYALDELTSLLQLPRLYEFQRAISKTDE